MIDTDKYKDMHGNQIDVDELLAEIKRLREGIQDICNTGTDTNREWMSMALTKLMELIE